MLFGVANAQETVSNPNNDNGLLLMNNSITDDNIQTKARQANFIFKIDYEANSKIDFTAKDAAELRKFLIYGEQLISCNQEKQSVISQDEESSNEFKFVSVVDELKTAGYQVNNLVCNADNIVFAIGKLLDPDCNDCKQIEISKELLDKFKDVDYGGDLIDLGLGSDSEDQLNSFEMSVSNELEEQTETRQGQEPVIINQPQPRP